MVSRVHRVVPLAVLICGVVLVAPFVAAMIWLSRQYAVGVGIDLESWRFWAALLSPIIGIAAIIWSLTRLLRKPRGLEVHGGEAVRQAQTKRPGAKPGLGFEISLS